MKNFHKVSSVIFGIALIFGATGLATTFAATDPGLGEAETFSIIGQTEITGTGTISGDVGMNAKSDKITALTPADVGGTIYSTDGVPPAEAILDPQVQADLQIARDDMWGQASDGSIGPALDGLTVTTGVYDIGAGRLNGGVLTLDGPGTYIFRASSDFVSSGSINLTNGARACDVYWGVSSLATINGSEFTGTIIAETGIHFGDSVALDGRALALGGDVTLLNNTISGPECETPSEPATLNVIKTVVNDDGGTATSSDFTINVDGTNVSPSSFTGSEEGVEVTLDAGAYEVTETAGPDGYLATGSGDCSGTIASGETRTCTITNNDIAPQLVVNKVVINDDGGTNVIADFPLFVDGSSVESGVATTTTIGEHTVSETTDPDYTATIGGDCAADGTVTLALGDVETCTITNNDIAPPSDNGGGGGGGGSSVPPIISVVKVPNPLSLPDGSGTVEYTYTLDNIGTVPVQNVTMVGDTCSPITLVSGDTNTNARLDVDETWVYTCSTTLTETHTNVVTATGWANGISASDTANATVVVGLSVVPPLINVTKVPNPLVLPDEGGTVTYTNKVTNPGTVALSNVQLTDDKCGPVEYVSGDTNGDNLLDTSETWTYTCTTNLTETTANTVTARGDANGLTARDSAIATVVSNDAAFAIGPELPEAGGLVDKPYIVMAAIAALGAVVYTAGAQVYSRRREVVKNKK